MGLPMFPDGVRCETCKHKWQRGYHRAGHGECRAISRAASELAQPLQSGGMIDEIDPELVVLDVHDRFGCVLWEPKAESPDPS